MSLPDRRTLTGMAIGAFTATLLAAIGPGAVYRALADEFRPTGINPDNLVIFEDRPYIVEHEDWVATDPLSTARVKKVEAGKVSYVTITTTATGTYSSDAMFSDHVQYPGISVEELRRPRNHFGYWHHGRWFGFYAPAADSFFYYDTGDTAVISWDDIACVAARNFVVC